VFFFFFRKKLPRALLVSDFRTAIPSSGLDDAYVGRPCAWPGALRGLLSGSEGKKKGFIFSPFPPFVGLFPLAFLRPFVFVPKAMLIGLRPEKFARTSSSRRARGTTRRAEFRGRPLPNGFDRFPLNDFKHFELPFRGTLHLSLTVLVCYRTFALI